MTRMLSFGGRIRSGCYRLQCRYASAVNYVSGEAFAFVVGEETGPGPLNIVLAGDRPEAEVLEIRDRVIRFGRLTIPVPETAVYDAGIDLRGADRGRFSRNLSFLRHALVLHAPPKSLAFLMDPGRRGEFGSPFEQTMAGEFEQGSAAFAAGDFSAGTKLLRGKGYGLTPAGDDFLAGYLIALQVCGRLTGRDFSPAVQCVAAEAKGSSGLVNAFLACAAGGYVADRFNALLRALAGSDPGRIIEKSRLLFSAGATSGADQAVGFLSGCLQGGI